MNYHNKGWYVLKPANQPYIFKGVLESSQPKLFLIKYLLNFKFSKITWNFLRSHYHFKSFLDDWIDLLHKKEIQVHSCVQEKYVIICIISSIAMNEIVCMAHNAGNEPNWFVYLLQFLLLLAIFLEKWQQYTWRRLGCPRGVMV